MHYDEKLPRCETGIQKIFCYHLFVSNSYCLVENSLKLPNRAGCGLKKEYAWESPTGSAQVVFETPTLHWLRWQGVEYRRVYVLFTPAVDTQVPLSKPQLTHSTIVSNNGFIILSYET